MPFEILRLHSIISGYSPTCHSISSAESILHLGSVTRMIWKITVHLCRLLGCDIASNTLDGDGLMGVDRDFSNLAMISGWGHLRAGGMRAWCLYRYCHRCQTSKDMILDHFCVASHTCSRVQFTKSMQDIQLYLYGGKVTCGHYPWHPRFRYGAKRHDYS